MGVGLSLSLSLSLSLCSSSLLFALVWWMMGLVCAMHSEENEVTSRDLEIR